MNLPNPLELTLVAILICTLGLITFESSRPQVGDEKQRQCLENLKEVSVASLMYANDFDSVLPGNDPRSVDNSPGNGLPAGFMDQKAPRNWAKCIAPYTGKDQVFRCPAETKCTDADWDPIPNVAENGYLANGVVTNHAVALIPNPEGLILFQEEQTYLRVAEERPNRIWDDKSNVAENIATRLDSSRWSNTHGRGGNLIFCDGHTVFKLKDSIGFGEFGATLNEGDASLCSDGIAARQHFMLPSGTSQETADLRQSVSCPTEF